MSNLSDFSYREFTGIYLGKPIGSGAYRRVYEHCLDDSLVIKVEEEPGDFANVIEHMLWKEIEHFKVLARWFAPVIAISPSGSVLLQKRTLPIQKKHLPKRIPNFLFDVKHDNWGMIDGHPVCHDYGNIAMTSKWSLVKSRFK